MTTVVLIIAIKLALVVLRWPEVLTRIGGWIARLFVRTGEAVTPQREEEVLPRARVHRG